MFTQTFPPDPAAVGQHFADAARELARRGHQVVVYTSAIGYDDPSVSYLRSETTQEGVKVRRFMRSSFGKGSMGRRVLAAASFMVQCAWFGLRTPRLGGILFSTSPPFIGIIGCLVGWIRGAPVGYWAMDLNPEQLIALGKLHPDSFLVRVFERLNRVILRRSALVVALDPMMAARLEKQGDHDLNITVIPPWSPDDRPVLIDRFANEFRLAHCLGDSIVVMYSGNHTMSNPLTTLLDAAIQLRDDNRVRFVFVGGGAGKAQVDACVRENFLKNVLSLPYEPRERLPISLSAADIHAVSLGDNMVGIIHPSKVYGAMAVSRPILYFGPSPSHVSALVEGGRIGWCVAHGDLSGAVSAIRSFAGLPREERDAMGTRARAMLTRDLSPARLCAEFCDVVEKRLGLACV